MKNKVIIPVGKKLLIKEIKPETKTASGLYLPEMAQKKTFQGVVVGKGDQVEEIQVGDVVHYADHAMPSCSTLAPNTSASEITTSSSTTSAQGSPELKNCAYTLR